MGDTVGRDFNPETLIPGTNIKYGEVTGGNCVGGEPIIGFAILVRKEVRAQTFEEFTEYGAFLTKLVERTGANGIGCVNYQALLAAGVAVNGCESCPERKKYFQ